MRSSIVRGLFVLSATALAGSALAACGGSRTFTPAARTSYALRPSAACPTRYTGPHAIPVTIVNDSGLPSNAIYLYMLVDGSTGYLAADGTIKPFSATNAKVPGFALACFNGATKFNLPPTNAAARLYIAFSPDFSVTNDSRTPNCCEQPDNPTGFKNPNYGLLWDFFEYNYPLYGNGSMYFDTSQVDLFALPLSVKLTTASNAYTIGTTNYASIVSGIKAAPYFKTLVLGGKVAGKNVVLRILSPGAALAKCPPCKPYSNFPATYFTSKAYWPSNPRGYLGAMLDRYKEAGTQGSALYHKIVYAVYQLKINGASCNAIKAPGTVCPTYWASSDGTSNFVFNLRSGASGYDAPAVVKIPISELDTEIALGQTLPYPAPGPGANVQYYLWKAMTEDMNRGVVMNAELHPVAPTGSKGYGGAQPVGKNYYPAGQLENVFSDVIHKNFIGNRAYGFAYDDSYGQSNLTLSAGQPKQIVITINKMVP